MRALLAAATLALLPASVHADRTLGRPPEPDRISELLMRAHRDAQPSTTYIHLLMSSSQATLKRMTWDLRRWGLERHRKAVQEEYEDMARLIGRFREKTEEVEAAMDPLRELYEKAAKDPGVVRAAQEDIPDSVAEQVAEIQKMRDEEYDPELGRARLSRARYSLQKAERWLGASELAPPQMRVLALSERFLRELRRIRASALSSLPPKKEARTGAQRQGRRLVMKDLERLEADADDLPTEIARLRIYYEINNHLNGYTGAKDAHAGKEER